ncbi:MAG: hypothetical protein ACRDCE_15530 [Cetobacterium sp.]|uniref:hypothetical protein n=1 Tax=Cetobacterium sp. TaxID=2071632 RepID=UPI003EE7DD87
MLIDKALVMFNHYYQTNAEIIPLGKGSFLFSLNNGMKEIQGEGEAIHFLMCRTTHYHFIPNRSGVRAFNLAFMAINDTIKNGAIHFSENIQGKITLWFLKGGEWSVITTFENKDELYYNLLKSRGVFSIIRNVEEINKSGWLSRLARWFK